MWILILITTILIHNTTTIESEDTVEIKVLYDHLIENLKADPRLLASEFSYESQRFFDKKINSFLDLILKSKNAVRRKRNAAEKNVVGGNYVDFKLYRTFPRMHPKEIKFFKQNNNWFAVYLEGNKESQTGQQIVVKQFQNETSTQRALHEVENGVNIAILPLKSSVFIAVSENVNDDHVMNVYKFTDKEGLTVMDKINCSNAIHTEIWQHKKQQTIFMSVVRKIKETGNEKPAAMVILYQWKGESFEPFQTIRAHSIEKVKPFFIGNTGYLALVNGERDTGNEKTYSEIWRYDELKQKYETFQKLLTSNCSDLEYFRMNLNNETEYFLITTNQKDHNARTGNISSVVTSVIYKFVDNYFIPFHGIYNAGVKQWLPIETETKGNVILLASTSESLQCLQYDGWRFEKCNTHLKNVSNETIKDVQVLQYGKLLDKYVLVMITKNSDEVLVEINSSPENKVRKLHDELLSWCRDSVKLVDTLSDNVLGETRRGDNIEDIQSGSQLNATEEDELLDKLRIYQNQLSTYEDSLHSPPDFENLNTENATLIAETIIINEPTILQSINADFMNGMNITDVIDNILDINEGFEITGEVQFDVLHVSEPINTERVNNIDKAEILHTNNNLEFDELSIEGDVRISNDLEVSETINGIRFDKQNILLKRGDQNFSDFALDNLLAENMKSDSFSTDMSEEENGAASDDEAGINEINHMKVKALAIGGYINGVKIPTLNKFALRNAGDQDIVVPCYFNNLEADSLEYTENFSGKLHENFVRVSEGAYSIKKDVRFAQKPHANNLTASSSLNSIPVGPDGSLDILLKDIPEKQSITGQKNFESLQLRDSIKLKGKIKGEVFDKLKPFRTIDTVLELAGDRKITGSVIIEKIIKADNIVSTEKLNSLRRVRDEALRLNDEEITNRMEFLQNLNVDDVFARKINNIDARLLVVNGAKQSQIVRGWKKFRGDLEITGNTEVLIINHIDMEELENNVLRTSGNQIVEGKHHVNFVVADGGITSNTINFGSIPWKDVIRTNEDQSINGTITFSKNLTAKSITAQNVDLKGSVNNENITEILNDVVTEDSTREILGIKTFRNVTIHFLETGKESLKYPKNENNLHLSNVDGFDILSVKNINFNSHINDIDKNDFEDILDETLLELILNDDMKLKNITVLGEVFIHSNSIGTLSLEDFENSTVKIDEPYDFDYVEFHNVIINRGVELQGHVENLDLDNVFENNQWNEQPSTVLDKKTFHRNISIDGKVLMNDTLNARDVSGLCDFLLSTSDGMRLVLKGDVHFAKGPDVQKVNDLNIKDNMKKIWFKNQETNVKQNMKFENVSFSGVMLQGLLNDINITHLAENYMSKSKDQEILEKHVVSDLVVFQESVVAPNLVVDGDINEIHLNDFIKSILLNRSQLFEDIIYFENVSVQGLEGIYRVNDLDIENDVMRYDKPNIVIGKKIFHDLEVGTLQLNRSVAVQGVDLLDFTTNAVLRNGQFRIEGELLIHRARFVNGLSLKGTLNGLKFDEKNLFLKRQPQIISGKLTFEAETTKFKALNTRGLVNDVDINRALENQVNKEGDAIFKSQLTFRNNLTAKNVQFEGLIQGVNISELLINITKLDTLNNLRENYEKLLNMSSAVQHSLQGHGFYLDDFKTVFSEQGAIAQKIKLENLLEAIVIFSCEANNLMNVHLLTWNKEHNLFSEEFSKSIGPFPGFSSKVSMRGIDYIYIETEKAEGEEDSYEDDTHTGSLLYFDTTTIYIAMSVSTRGTQFLTTFELDMPKANCLLFIDYYSNTNTVCFDEANEVLNTNISFSNAFMAATVDMGNVPLVLTLREKLDFQESGALVWKFNQQTKLFDIVQEIYGDEPRHLSTIVTSYGRFIAITYFYKTATLDFGKVVIWRFEAKHDKFMKWQTIKVDTPTRTEFALLPSGELILYVLTENPISPLLVYTYEGIVGFSRKIVGSLIPNVKYMNQFSLGNDHFIVLQNNERINILQAIFKGHFT